MSYQNPLRGPTPENPKGMTSMRADSPMVDPAEVEDVTSADSQLCQDKACKGQRPHISHPGFAAPGPLSRAQLRHLDIALGGDGDVEPDPPDVWVDNETPHPWDDNLGEDDAPEADDYRQHRIDAFRRMDSARSRLVVVLSCAFTRDELAVLFDRLDDDAREDYPPYVALKYALGQAWADYNNPAMQPDEMNPIDRPQPGASWTTSLHAAADLLAADDANIGKVIYRLREMARWER